MKIEDVAEWFYLADEDFETANYLSNKYKPIDLWYTGNPESKSSITEKRKKTW